MTGMGLRTTMNPGDILRVALPSGAELLIEHEPNVLLVTRVTRCGEGTFHHQVLVREELQTDGSWVQVLPSVITKSWQEEG